MDREQMVEKAARALASLQPDEDWPTNEALGGNLTGTRDDEFRDGMRQQATEILDAVLPAVSTVAELEALPARSVVIDAYENAYECGDGLYHRPGDEMSGYASEVELPATVVWQP